MNWLSPMGGSNPQSAWPVITVAHVVLSLEVGGLERMVVSLIRGVDRTRFRSLLYCIEREGHWITEVNGFCDVVSVMRKKPGLAYALPIRLSRLLVADRVDIVHCHNFAAFFYGSLGGKFAGRPAIVYTVHGPEIPSRKRQMFFQRLGLADAVVTVSEHMRRSAVDRLGFDAARVTIVPNGIRVADEKDVRSREKARSELGIGRGTFLVGSVGRLSPEKDYDTLLYAFAQIVSEHNDTALFIVGDGPLRDALEEHASSLGLGNRVQFLGARQDVPDILAALDVFVMSSRREGLPVAILEAMAAGLPVVATSVGGIPDAVVDRSTGILVPAGDARKLASAVTSLLADKDLRRAMGQEGRKRAVERFDVSEMVRAYEALYCRLVMSKRDKR